METLKEYYYTYYSYEEWGRGYIGSRGCSCLPEEDVKYFGSFSDKTFKPTQKIILGIYSSRNEAFLNEIKLHNFYDVANNPHFANKAKLTTTKFYVSKEIAIANGKNTAKKQRKEKTGLFGFSYEERLKYQSIAGKKSKELGVGIHALTKEQRVEYGKKYGKMGSSVKKSENCKKVNSQKWMCLETGFITNPGNLTQYQKRRGIDTCKRKRLC